MTSHDAARDEVRARGTLAARHARDAALRRTRAVIVGAAAAAVGLSGALSEVAAQAFQGHPQHSEPSRVPATTAAGRAHAPRVSVPRPQRIPAIDGQPAPLQPPAEPPAATQDTQPAPAPAPEPQVSGGS